MQSRRARRSVEAPASGCDVIEGSAARIHANHLINPAFAALGQTISPSSAARQSRAEALMPLADDPLAILYDRENQALPVLCRGEVENGRAYTLATALFHLDPEGVTLAVSHGPEPRPFFTTRTELAVA